MFDKDIHYMFIYMGSQEQSFFPSDSLIYGISRDSSKNFNIRTWEHMILDQLRMGARQTKNAPLSMDLSKLFFEVWQVILVIKNTPLHRVGLVWTSGKVKIDETVARRKIE